MNLHHTTIRRSAPATTRGFSLPEVTISAAILSTITIALGLALFRTQHRTADAQAAFIDVRNRNAAIRQITDDLRWATQVTYFDPTAILCMAPVPNQPGVSEQIGYYLDAQNQLIAMRQGKAATVVAKNVTILQLSGLGEVEGADIYVKNVKIRMQIGTDENTLVERVIPLANRPIFAGVVVE